MKSAVILAAMAAVASAATVSKYQPLANRDTGKCIVVDEFDSDRKEYSLTLGNCNDAVEFASIGDGKHLQSADGYCLSTHGNTGAKGARVVLAKCKADKPGKQWTSLASTDQWKNGYNLCLDYDSKEDTMVQSPCIPAPANMCTQMYTFGCDPTPVGPPPPPRPTPISCAQWSTSWMCPKDYSLISNPKYVSCDGSSKDCVQKCCVYTPAPAMQKCGSWSVKNGGPVNACGSGYQYIAGDKDVCLADGSNCRKVCCTPVPIDPPKPQTQLCGAWSVENGGPINACGNGFTYTAKDGDKCALDGTDCQEQCCTPVSTQLCMSWSIQKGGPVNSCPEGFGFSASPEDRCNSDASNCENLCCAPLKN